VEWKKNKLIPAASVKAIEEVGVAAKSFNYAVALGTIKEALDNECKDCDDSIDKIADEFTKLNNKFHFCVNGFEAACAGKTLEQYLALWAGSIRGVGTTLPILATDNDKFSKGWEKWKSFSNK
jgi:hypothetical protein